MGSNFSSIGFDIESFDSMLTLVKGLKGKSTFYPSTVGGSYYCFSSPEGAELWAQYSPSDDLVGCNVHFKGEGRFKLRLIQSYDCNSYECSPLDGIVLGTIIDDEADIPFVCDCPDFRTYNEIIRYPLDCTMQITAFANPDIEVMNKSSDSELQLAEKAYIPSGTFEPGGEPIDPPKPYGIFSGKILKCKKNVNSVCNLPFYSLLIETLGGTIDVVSDPEYFKESIKEGKIISGQFYLTGRLIEPHISHSQILEHLSRELKKNVTSKRESLLSRVFKLITGK